MSFVDRNLDNSEEFKKYKSGEKSYSILGIIRIIIYSVIVLAGVFVIFTAFYAQSHTIYVDNPTGTGITFKIGDNDEQKLDAYSHNTFNISPGKYDLIVDGKNVGSFEKKYFDRKSFLNPTQDIYIQEYILYGNESNFDKLPNNHIEVYGNEAEGPFLTYSGIYITGDWNFDLDDEIPSEVKLKRGNDYAIKSKIYRFDEFAQMYNETYAETYETGSIDSGTGTQIINNHN